MDEMQARLLGFQWLEQLTAFDDVVAWSDLAQGFAVQGQRVTVIGQQGIWKPKVFSLIPISIRTSIVGPYDDTPTSDGLLLYRYRGTDPYHRENVGLREAYRQQVPLMYFFNLIDSRYLPIWPVYIVGDDPKNLAFTVAVDDQRQVVGQELWSDVSPDETPLRRRYITSAVRNRLHQRSFRERVIAAYKRQCSFCRLRHEELLDAAHIIGDREDHGDPVVNNGLSLCKIHHAAFDRNFIGVTPDYKIQVNPRLLEEHDGPMLRHGIQELHGQELVLPNSVKQRPDRDRLQSRYADFLAAI